MQLNQNKFQHSYKYEPVFKTYFLPLKLINYET